MKKYILLCLLPLFVACRSGEKKVIENVDLEITVKRLDKDLQTLSPENIVAVRERYGSFFELFNTSIINIGHSENPLYFDMLQNFLQHDIVKKAYAAVNATFPDEKKMNIRFTDAFRRVAYYFPEMKIPEIVAYIAGFNEAIVLADSTVGIGLDRFLGEGYELYSQLGFQRYLQQLMRPERIAIMAVQSWISSEYVLAMNSDNTLLNTMIHEGKILYALKQCFPEEPDSLLMGFTKAQYEFCVENEPKMWETMIMQKMLYTTSQFVIQKLTADAPSTAEFSSAAPGKAANWIAYRIVSNYMKRKKDMTLPALMEEKNAQLILKESRYNP